MSHETPVLSSSLKSLREDIETTLLEMPWVTFVSVGFLAADPNVVLVSIGTTRPDLLQVLATDLATQILRKLHESDPDRAWNPDIHILKGRTKS
jgi:hypothetical protein